MSLSPALIPDNQIPIRRSNIDVSHLPLYVQQIGPVANGEHGVSVPELMWEEMPNPGQLAQLAQVLAHPPICQPPPTTARVRDKQGGQTGGQVQPLASFEPAFNILAGGFAENDGAVPVGFAARNEGDPMALFCDNIGGSQRGQFAHAEAGVESQAPQGQGANVQPVAVAFVGLLFQIREQGLQFIAPRSAGKQLGAGWDFGLVNRIRFNPAPFDQPGQPDFKRLVVGFDGGLFQPALFGVVEKGVNLGRGRRPGA